MSELMRNITDDIVRGNFDIRIVSTNVQNDKILFYFHVADLYTSYSIDRFTLYLEHVGEKYNVTSQWVENEPNIYQYNLIDLDEESLIDRLRIRAKIRRNAKGRKSVEQGQPDRIADLLEESANRIEELEIKLGKLYTRI